MMLVTESRGPLRRPAGEGSARCSRPTRVGISSGLDGVGGLEQTCVEHGRFTLSKWDTRMKTYELQRTEFNRSLLLKTS